MVHLCRTPLVGIVTADWMHTAKVSCMAGGCLTGVVTGR